MAWLFCSVFPSLDALEIMESRVWLTGVVSMSLSLVTVVSRARASR